MVTMHRVPGHVWVQVVFGEVGDPCWGRDMYRGLVLRYTASVRGWGVTVLRMPESDLTRRATEYGW